MTRSPLPAILLALLATTLLPPPARAGTTGKIAGRVVDGETGEPLPYANVVLVGTQAGAATDDQGRFVILGITPGRYSVRAAYLGYAETTLSDVRVNIDHTTRLILELRSEAIEVGGTVVIADREYFQKDLTASQSLVGAEEIEATPATELGDLLELQAGVTTDAGGGLHFRGGRSGEVAFLVDGVSFTDAFSGGQAVAVETASIEEVQVISGAFNAEYGQAMSGVVNIVTKEGAGEWTGNFSGYSGDYVAPSSETFWGIEKLSPTAVRNLQATLSGPLLHNRVSLFASARAVGSDGYLYGRRVFNFYDVADFSSLDSDDWQTIATGDSSLVAMNPYRKYSAQTKLTAHLGAGFKLRYNLLLEDSRSDSYNHFFRYNPGAGPTYRKTGVAHTATATWAFGANAQTFVDYGISRFVNHQQSWRFADRRDPRYYFSDFLDQVPPHGYSYSTGGVFPGWWEQETATDVWKVDLTSQIDLHNMIKLGAELRRHRLDTFSQWVIDGKVGDPFVETFAVRPGDLGAYLQNKLEVEDLILNIGVRLDRFDPASVIPFDPRDPNVESPLRSFFDHSSGRIVGFDDVVDPGAGGDYRGGRPVYEGSAYQVAWNDTRATELRRQFMYKPATVKYQISPRVGLSYPITDEGGIHVSYGHFFQMPTLATIYSNPEWRLGDGVGITALMGNPDIEAQKTVQYEIGLQQQIGDGGRLSADFFFRDFRNLLASDRIVETYSAGKKYAQYNNRDQANARGIALTFSDEGERLYWSFDYTFQIAEGLASDPAQAFRRLAADLEPLPQLVPLDWDRRHNLNGRLAWSSARWGLSALAKLWSPTPYTPDIRQVGAAVENGGRIPPFYELDLEAYYKIDLGSVDLELFGTVFNALNRKNELFVYADTGRATESLAELEANELSTEFVNSVESFFDNPSLFSAPRLVHIGASLNF